MSAKLYVVGTPIGNLGDLSPRGQQTLADCDFIAAEDTRVTLKLLNRFGIKKPLVSYHEHNRFEMSPRIVERLLRGESCALVTDAGMPAVSDPGEDLVRMCHERGVQVESVPGPTAFATALAISGMPGGRWSFEGFLSVNKNSRAEHIKSLVGERRTMIFYEAPHKLSATLRDLEQALGDRDIAIVRELTKIHEQVIRTTLRAAAQRFSQESVRGEIVLIVSGADAPQEQSMSPQQAAAAAREYMEQGLPASEAARQAAKLSGIKKGDIYKLIVREKEND